MKKNLKQNVLNFMFIAEYFFFTEYFHLNHEKKKKINTFRFNN